MRRRIPSSTVSSSASARAFVLTPEPSRLLAAWRFAVHALAVAGVAASGIGWPVKLGAVAAVLAHAAARRVPRPSRIVRTADGAWALPDRGLDGLELRPGTAVAPFWVSLRLAAPGARAFVVLLLKDQVDQEAWRALQAELRRSRPLGTL
ncbi:MAG TPA: protein YgfX [Gammaproteobacteria bacterium]